MSGRHSRCRSRRRDVLQLDTRGRQLHIAYAAEEVRDGHVEGMTLEEVAADAHCRDALTLGAGLKLCTEQTGNNTGLRTVPWGTPAAVYRTDVE